MAPTPLINLLLFYKCLKSASASRLQQTQSFPASASLLFSVLGSPELLMILSSLSPQGKPSIPRKFLIPGFHLHWAPHPHPVNWLLDPCGAQIFSHQSNMCSEPGENIMETAAWTTRLALHFPFSLSNIKAATTWSGFTGTNTKNVQITKTSLSPQMSLRNVLCS